MSLDQPAWWFIAATILVAYAYALYPLAVATLARARHRTVAAPSPPSTLSIVLAAHNEAGNIERRLGEFAAALDASGLRGEIIVASDGSTDNTVALARAHPDPRIRVVELQTNAGKARALTEGCKVATGEVLVFADARQRWAPEVLSRLIAPFADPSIGATSGELVLTSESGELEGVGLYWKYEKWLRRNESRLHSAVGVSGSIAAVRRTLFHGVPDGIIVDDVYWPLRVAMQGYRVVHVSDAIATDRLPPRRRDEFRRKVRTLAGNFQLAARLPSAMLPWRNPIWLQFLSHKLARLLVPWALLLMLVASALSETPGMRTLFWLQVVGYSLAVVGLLAEGRRAARLLSPLSSFVLLNAAAWMGFWVWASGRTGRSWTKISYRSPETPAP